jgi:Amt family ammonium transporter
MSGCPQNVEAWESFIIGAIGGALYWVFSQIVFPKCKIDDPIDGLSYHFVCGFWGSFAVGLFHESEGAFHKDEGDQLGLQLCGCLAIFAWSAVLSVVLFGLLFIIKKLRMPLEVEILGLTYAELNWFGFGYKLRKEYTLEGGYEASSSSQKADTTPAGDGKATEPAKETEASKK